MALSIKFLVYLTSIKIDDVLTMGTNKHNLPRIPTFSVNGERLSDTNYMRARKMIRDKVAEKKHDPNGVFLQLLRPVGNVIPKKAQKK